VVVHIPRVHAAGQCSPRCNECMQAGGLSAAAGTHWAAIVEAVSAAVSAVLLAGGAWFAQRYLARGNTSVDAMLFERSDGFGLHVRPSIQSLGLSPLRLRHAGELAPVIEVSEYRGDDGSSFPGLRRETFTADDLVGPGETVTDSEIFLLSRPSTGILGWRIIFEVGIRRRLWLPPWRWVAATFVPLPVTSDGTAVGQVALESGDHELRGESDGGEAEQQGKA
jgi:hypothetical protein